MAAAVVWYRLWKRRRLTSQGYLTLGLVIASFAQLHTIVYPSLHPLEVSSGDLLWLLFGLILVLAIQAESRATLVELRTANTALEELREVEVEHAGLEERARLSRELHDGLAQDLWLAKLKAGRLSAMPNLDAESRELSAELAGAIDSGLAEARQAVMALRLGTGGTHAHLCEMMHRFMDDFADRFGLRTEYECDHSTPRLSQRAEVELLRIVQEALNNVHRHADATIVRVRFQTRDGIVSLSVTDNGKGFDPGALVAGGYGLIGMRERAGLVNGRLTIDSRPLDGTRVTIAVPIETAPVPDRVRV
jgi:two-component system sensor histidine kinase DegS